MHLGLYIVLNGFKDLKRIRRNLSRALNSHKHTTHFLKNSIKHSTITFSSKKRTNSSKDSEGGSHPSNHPFFINHLDYEERLSHPLSSFHISSSRFLSNVHYNSTPPPPPTPWRSKRGKWKRLDIKKKKVKKCQNFSCIPRRAARPIKKRSPNNQYNPFVWSLREKRQELWALSHTYLSCDDIFSVIEKKEEKKRNETSTHIWCSNS